MFKTTAVNLMLMISNRDQIFCSENCSGAILLLSFFLFFGSLKLNAQNLNSSFTKDSVSILIEKNISEELEAYYSLKFGNELFWQNIENKYIGNHEQFERKREILSIKLYQLFSDFSLSCLQKHFIDEQAKNVFENIVEDALLKLLFEPQELDNNFKKSESPLPTPSPGLECENVDFEKCDFTGWQLFEGNVMSSSATAFSYINVHPSTTWGTGFPALNLNGGREGVQHSIISTAANDPNVGISMVKPGGTCSAMLGDGFGAEWRASSIKRTIQITPSNYNFYYSYAVVMENPNHSKNDQPYFRIRLYDQNNNSIACANYDVYAGNGDPDWKTKGSGGNTLNYIDWQSAFIPLQGYIGQTLTIEFTTGDCTQGGHACYAYIEAQCDQTSQIKMSDTAVCAGRPVTITAPDGAKTYLWSNGATTQAITVQKAGQYWVKMEGTAGGCFAFDTINVGTYSVPVANFTADTACLGEATSFTDQSLSKNGIKSWQWDFLNSGASNSTIQNSTNTYNSAGTFNAKLTVTSTNGCTDDTLMQVFVAPKPLAAFSASTVCKDDSTSFTNQSLGTISKFQWDFLNDGKFVSTKQNDKFKYSTIASAKLKVTNQYGCSDSIVKSIVFHPQPSANFSATDVCFPDLVNFSSTSSINSGAIANFLWDFSDGSTANSSNPSHAFTSSGVKNIKLKVTSDLGCKDSISKTIHVFDKPLANFITSNVCDHENVILTNTSSVKLGAAFSSWQWDVLNDGNVEYSSKNISHLFSGAGTYRVLLKATTSDQCWDTISKAITIFEKPKVDFSFKNSCEGKPISFSNQSSANVVQWKWDFKNDQSVDNTTPNASFNFQNKGSYSTKLTVVSDKGCVDSVVKVVVVNPLPKAAFSATSVCYPLPINFSNTSSVSSGNIVYQKWKFATSNADTSNHFNPSKKFAQSGSYSIKLYVKTDSSCVDSVNKTIVYLEKPKVNFVVNDHCYGLSSTFQNTSTLQTSTFSSWSWDVDNNATTDYGSKNINHKFIQEGSYTVKLIGRSDQGCADTISKVVQIFPKPIANFSSTSACVSDSINFTNKSSISTGAIASTNWNFNNESSSSSMHQKVKFSSEGIKSVRLVVSSDKNCKDTADQLLTVFPLPLAQFNASEECLKNNTLFTNLSTISSKFSSNQIAQYAWNFGDNQSSSSINPSHQFGNAGSHNVTLILKSTNNCIDSITKSIKVHPLPVVKFSSTTPAGCAKWCVDFTNESSISTGAIKSYLWNFGEGTTSSLTDPSNCFQNEDSVAHFFDIALTATSDKGCINDSTVPSMITAYPITKADFVLTPNEIDENNNRVYFFNRSKGENSWLWDFNDGATSNERNVDHKFLLPGDYFVKLTVNNSYNCSDTISKKVHEKPVYSYHVPNAFTPNGDGVNDKFYVYAYNIVEFRLLIFNRYGEQIFESKDLSEGWDGSVNGNMVQTETYIYKLLLKDIFGVFHEEVGIVNCVK